MSNLAYAILFGVVVGMMVFISIEEVLRLGRRYVGSLLCPPLSLSLSFGWMTRSLHSPLLVWLPCSDVFQPPARQPANSTHQVRQRKQNRDQDVLLGHGYHRTQPDSLHPLSNGTRAHTHTHAHLYTLQ